VRSADRRRANPVAGAVVLLTGCSLFRARGKRISGDVGFGPQRPLVAIPSPLTPHPLLFLSPRAELAGAQRLAQHVTSSGTGRRAALACGVERSPEECEGCVFLSGALSDVGTRTGSETGLGVRSKLNGARTTPGISPCARCSRLVEMTCEEGAGGAFETCHPERSRGVS